MPDSQHRVLGSISAAAVGAQSVVVILGCKQFLGGGEFVYLAFVKRDVSTVTWILIT
jgi:hypothetical protein